jgi:hypothetical protein
MDGVIQMQGFDLFLHIIVLLDSAIIMLEGDVPEFNVFQTQNFFTTVPRLVVLYTITQDKSMMSRLSLLDITHINQPTLKLKFAQILPGEENVDELQLVSGKVDLVH